MVSKCAQLQKMYCVVYQRNKLVNLRLVCHCYEIGHGSEIGQNSSFQPIDCKSSSPFSHSHYKSNSWIYI